MAHGYPMRMRMPTRMPACRSKAGKIGLWVTAIIMGLSTLFFFYKVWTIPTAMPMRMFMRMPLRAYRYARSACLYACPYTRCFPFLKMWTMERKYFHAIICLPKML